MNREPEIIRFRIIRGKFRKVNPVKPVEKSKLNPEYYTPTTQPEPFLSFLNRRSDHRIDELARRIKQSPKKRWLKYVPCGKQKFPKL